MFKFRGPPTSPPGPRNLQGPKRAPCCPALPVTTICSHLDYILRGPRYKYQQATYNELRTICPKFGCTIHPEAKFPGGNMSVDATNPENIYMFKESMSGLTICLVGLAAAMDVR